MPRSTARRSPIAFAHILRALALIALLVGALPPTAPTARAEGSREITTGYRAFIEWHDTATSGGIPRQTTIKAFAQAGEQIFLGSSAMGILQGNIRIRPPSGSLPANADTCTERNGGNPLYGRIEDYAQEQAGPLTATNPAGFVPCVISAAETTAAGSGIWEFDFISPNPNGSLNTDPKPILANQEWAPSINPDPDRQRDNTSFWIAAWDVSVRDATSGDEIPGRVFANYIAFNLGGNATAAGPNANLGLDTEFYILTDDGYGYRVDMNGIDPFGFIFFANAEGIVDTRGNPIYRSLQLRGIPPNVNLPPGFAVHNPRLVDNVAENNITHKIFFEPPAADLPVDAASPAGTTWLLRTPEPPPTPQNVAFVGQEGTLGQAGTNPLGGSFTFEAPPNIGYLITIDTNRNGSFNDPSDRVLNGTTTAGLTSAFWDGLDGDGARVTAGSVPFAARVQLYVGEIHFPFIDAENNPNGMILERVRDATPAVTEPDSFTIYWNDTFSYDPTTAYDFSPCAQTDAPPPPAADIGARPTDPVCYGTALNQRKALLGVDSQAGTHGWTNVGMPNQGFGDRRLIDTWAYFSTPASSVVSQVQLAEADLSITKSSSPSPLVPGGAMTYSVVVTNNGPSPVVGARVTDDVPAQVLAASWTCVASGTGSCGQTSGTGNLIDTTVDLGPGETATFTIQGSLSPSATGSLENTATVRRPNDVTDPDQTNNTARNITPIQPVADLELTKSVVTPPAQVVPNAVVEFAVELRNRGPATATGVEVIDQLPAGLSFVGATPTKGSYNATTGVWTVGTMARDEVAVLFIRATWNGTAVTNTAQVSRSDQPDPDSTPNNNDPSEDDQSSSGLPLQIADLELTKTVSAPVVNVGANATFTIGLTNRGPADATGVRVNDRLPTGLAFISATASQGTYDPVSGEWTVGSLASGGSATLTIVVNLRGVGPFTNIAQVSAADQHDIDSTPNNDDPSEDDQAGATVAGLLADLSLSKTVDNPQPPFNGRIVYTVRVVNDGPSPATGVEVSDRLPVGLVLVSTTPSQGSYNSTTGLWTVGNLAVGGFATLLIEADVATGATLVNTAQVSKSDQPDPDSTPNNNVPSEDDQASVSLTPQQADLRLVKTVDNTAPPANGEVTYTITLTNDGPNRATNVQVSDRLPTGMTYIAHTAAQGSYEPTTGIWSVGTLNTGASTQLQVRARLSGIGPYTNTAQVSKSDQFDPDSTPNNNVPTEDDQDSVTITGVLADLSVSKAAAPLTVPDNGQVTYTIGVRNDGPSPATGVALGESLPPGAVLLGSTPSKGTYDPATSTWTVGALAVGETATLEIRVQLSGASSYVNTVQVIASDQPDPDSTPNNNVPSEDDQASATVFTPGGAPVLADLELNKEALRVDKVPNGIAYLIEVFNRGPNNATGVEVTDRLPPGTSFVSAAPSQGRYDPSTGVWTIGNLPVGRTATLTILALLTTNQPVTNSAQVSKSDQPDPDSTPNNNVPTEDDQDSVTGITAIDLLSFEAVAGPDGVLVTWETGTELGTAGFHLYRSASGERAKAQRVTEELIVARGGPAMGARYSFLDTSAAPGTTYIYWLAEIERGGGVNEYGPVSTAPGLSQGFAVYLPLLRR